MSYRGMDPGVITQVADGMAQQAGSLETVTQHVDSLLQQVSVLWPGQDAHDFHQFWLGQHRPHLQSTVDGLKTAVTGLRAQVQAQVDVSGGSSDTSGSSDGSDESWVEVIDRIHSGALRWELFEGLLLSPALEISARTYFGRFAPRDAAGRFISVDQSKRSILNLVAKNKGANWIAKAGKAEEFERLETTGRFLERGGYVLSFAGGAWDQWEADMPDQSLDNSQRAGRAVAVGASAAGGAWAGAWAGSAVGAAMGSVVPGPGTAIGAVVGGAVGGLAGSEAGKDIGRIIAPAMGDVADGVADVIGGDIDAAKSVADAVSFWR